MRARTFINEDYSVGIICALEVEMAAVRVALDEEHRQPTMVRETTEDYTGYVFGRIGAHNVVINAMRKASAATVANLMMRRFPIKIGLMVGVGGGVWSDSSERDIRLGDVVVSQPEGSHGGVVLGEILGGYGKTDSVSRFRRTGILERPPQPLLDAVQSLERRTASEDSRVRAHLEAMDAKSSLLRHGAGHPGREHDELFEASCEHIGGDTCDDCDRSRLVRNRPRRTDNNPRVHHGRIASCNAAVKDGLTRDRIAREEGVICFETTAAGLMATFPCVVIRGICDYADSHRNHRWQVYAAAVAAAYAKEVLLCMSAADLAPERWASEVTGRLNCDKIRVTCA
jgi:nucleoside phosphorylase